MFGNRKMKASVEKNREVFLQIAEKGKGFESEVTQIEEDGKQARRDISHLAGSIGNLSEHASANIQAEEALMDSMEELAEFFRKNQENYNILKELADKQLEVSTFLVEENKHYTTPAKYLSMTPENLRKQNYSYEKHLDEMAELGRRINVLALNAAIEAGHMGEDGKQFVSVAEEIRQNVISYEKEALMLREEISESQKQIEELENTIQKLVQRMKGNNKGTARLLKKCQDTVDKAKTISFCGFYDKMAEFKDKLTGMRNLDEEIVKSSERSKIQLEDIEEVLKGQKFKIAEVASDISYVFQLAEEQVK
uniref:methyl-accepting chemotaxis protein n=1 Tax=Agathobacter sp. TaxID=2021311 RepID=UPI004055C870